MGGYTALKLTETHKIKNLILVVPAVYATEAYSTLFGPKFALMLRKHESWRETDAAEMLEKFTGRLLLVVASRDATVPSGVTDLIWDSTTQAKKERLVMNSAHPLIPFANKNPKVFARLYKAMKDFV
jgi:esterase/lipase